MPYRIPNEALQTAPVIPERDFRRWIEPWYVAYAINWGRSYRNSHHSYPTSD